VVASSWENTRDRKALYGFRAQRHKYMIYIYNLHVVDFCIFFHVYQREVEHVDILVQAEEEQETEKCFMD
jgi:hypothetical protein